ncbi:MAG: phosphatidylserine decarboxylase family protein [Clostridiaceae bacterium]|nr:phosphatidylserine decarboxylase family protein [Clostridiaceae bacterium]
MNQFPIAQDGFLYIIIGLVLSVVLFLINPWVSLAGLLPTLFIIFFFRNPRRTGPELADSIISPADGRIMSVTPVDRTDYYDGPAVKITIFLSLFNVHINRAPVSGRVYCHHYRPGQYLPAFKSHASDINERNTIGLVCNDRKILVHQITGFVARRVVCDVDTGDMLLQRQRFGMIRFGSCTEVICPSDTLVLVQPGDRVKGGLSVIAQFSAGSEVAHVS